jgi:hypothetical protein
MDAGIDLGKAQVDASLLAALAAAGVKDADAREIARVDGFGGLPAGPWCKGLDLAARLANGEQLALDWAMLLQPWDTICQAMANGQGPAEGLAAAILALRSELQIALVSAVGAVAQRLATTAAKVRPGATMAGARVAAATDGMPPDVASHYLSYIDGRLVNTVRRLLQMKDKDREQRLRAVGEQIVQWLVDHGKLIRTPLGQSYYLYGDQHRLYALESDAWHGFLYRISGINPASRTFAYLCADCLTAAEDGEPLDVVRVAHWHQDMQLLRVSAFNGQVWRLDGETIECENNGDGPVLFEDAVYWQPYEPNYSAGGQALAWATEQLPQWDGDQQELSLFYRNWWLATFFCELCPTRPVLLLKGEKGSGKSMAMRVMLRLLFGLAADVSGVPDKADAFTAMTSNSHIVVMDNMDVVTQEIRDKIAALSTGKQDELRTLYKTNEKTIVRYRCWLAVTSRTPDTLQRDDLVDRILLLPVKRIDDAARSRESKFLQEVLQKRNQFWGDCLTALNSVVAHIRWGGIPDRGGLRMEDWAALGTVMARAVGQDDIWENGLNGVKTRQAAFLLEYDVLSQAIDAYVSDPTHSRKPLETRKLYSELKAALYGQDRPDASWPRSVRSFGRHLAGSRREIAAHLAKSGIQMSWYESGTRMYYQFE